MTYRVEIRSGVSDYLRGLEGFTREGRLLLELPGRHLPAPERRKSGAPL